MRFPWTVPPLLALSLASLASLAACGGGGTGGAGGAGGTTGTGTPTSSASTSGSATGGGGSATGGGGTGGAGGPLCTMPTPVKCADQVILNMNLQADAAPGKITSAADGAGWTSKIDATAGGAFTSTPHSYVYGKFTDQGLEKVSISDEASLDSMAWDVAFRRYVVRVNSDDSGPSCVQAARVPGTAKYEDLMAVPAGLAYHPDDTFTESCDIIPDGSGLPDSPATALSSYWTYPGCVQMTNNVFVVALADGRHVKLTVDDYYSPTVQAQCDATEMIPMSNSGSANFVVRWAFLK